MRNITILLGALALVANAPSTAQFRGDEPVAVPRAVRQGIDFVYVDPQMSSVARKRQRPQNWLARMFSDGGGRQGSPNPMFIELAHGLQQYQLSWGRLPQTKIAAGAALKLGSTGRRVGQLRERLGLASGGSYDELVADRVADYQRVHGLGQSDGIAGKGTIASLNLGAAHYQRRIAINMERAFRLPAVRAFDRYVVVDSGAAQAFLFNRDRIADSMRVIVGSPKTKTPMMAVLMRNAKANPYWHVPPELVKSLTAAKVKEMGVGYFDQFHYDVMSDWSANRHPVDPKSINWRAVAASKAKPTFMVRQQPGPWNSMGAMKFEMPNDFGIYLHDTPHKEKFDEPDRWISNGCVRLEDYRRFGSWVFGRMPEPSGTPEQVIPLPRAVPVYMTYLTVSAGRDGVMFRPDPYGFDALAMPQMFGAGQRNASAI